MSESYRKNEQNYIFDSFNDDPIESTFETTSSEQRAREQKIGRILSRSGIAILMALTIAQDSGRIYVPFSHENLLSSSDTDKFAPDLPLVPGTYGMLQEIINPFIENSENMNFFTFESQEARRAYGMNQQEEFIGIKMDGYSYEGLNLYRRDDEKGWNWHTAQFSLLREGKRPSVPFQVVITTESSTSEYTAYFSIPAADKNSSEYKQPYLLGFFSIYGNSANNKYSVGMNNERYEIDGERVFKYLLDGKTELTNFEIEEFRARERQFKKLMEYVTLTLPTTQTSVKVSH